MFCQHRTSSDHCMQSRAAIPSAEPERRAQTSHPRPAPINRAQELHPGKLRAASRARPAAAHTRRGARVSRSVAVRSSAVRKDRLGMVQARYAVRLVQVQGRPVPAPARRSWPKRPRLQRSAIIATTACRLRQVQCPGAVPLVRVPSRATRPLKRRVWVGRFQTRDPSIRQNDRQRRNM